MLSLRSALRLTEFPQAAFVGAGGKTTAIFFLARQLESPVIVTTTTHMGSWELKNADKVHILDPSDRSLWVREIKPEKGVILCLGPLGESCRYTGLNENMMYELHEFADRKQIPLLIEADGSRMLPLKAPAEHEPLIPKFVGRVVVVAGMRAVGQPLSDKNVHRPLIFSELASIDYGDKISPEAILKVLCHPHGGVKNIPPNAEKILLLNQADTEWQQAIAREIAQMVLKCYERVIVASLAPEKPSEKIMSDLQNHQLPKNNQISSVHEHIAAIILAAGESRRFGRPKQTVDWDGEPLLRRIARIALQSDLSEVIVILGAQAEQFKRVLEDLKVKINVNSGWEEGQSSSVRLGIQSLEKHINSAIFLLADQPYISPELIHALVAEHNVTMAPIVAPLVDGQRGNPVLFDRITFSELEKLTGNIGGRAILERFTTHYINWPDPKILVDIDTQEDYLKLINQ